MSGRTLMSLGLVLVSGSWGFVEGFFVSPASGLFVLVASAGIVCCVAGAPRSGLSRRAGAACALSAAAAQCVVQLVLPAVMARHHRIPRAAELLGLLMAGLGLETGVDAEGNLLLETHSGARPFAITWELAALPMVLRLLAGAAAVSGAGALRIALPAVVLCAAGRMMLLPALLSSGMRLSLAWEPAATLITFLPAVPMLARCLAGASPPPAPAGRRVAAGWALVCASGAFAGIHLGHHPAGPQGGGRVLIDESRSGWEPTDTPFDATRFGQKSLYNYALWKAWIDRHYTTRVVRRPLAAEDLEAADVLIVKTPTQPYDAATIDRIEAFVRKGGGLLLVGDHTNLFGMSTVLNRLARPYGIRFELDDTFPLDHEASDIFTPPLVAPHPVLRGIDRYPFETSCSLSVGWEADLLMVGRRLGAEPVDYGHVNFFGDIALQPHETFGLFVQAAAVRHGRGRVAAFCDSTNFSNFSLLWPGRRQLTVNLLDWLDRDAPIAGGGPPVGAASAAALIALLAGLVALRGAGPAARALALGTGVALLVGAASAAARDSAAKHGSIPAKAPARTLAFETEVSSPRLDPIPPVVTRARPSWRGFNALFINAARAGFWPEVVTSLETALGEHAWVALVNPRKELSQPQAHALSRFLARGGNLLVLDSVLNVRSTAARILAPYGVVPAMAVVAPAERRGARVPSLSGVAAGTSPALQRRVLSGGVELIGVPVGRGRVYLATDGALFSDAAVGGVYASPGELELERLRGQTELFARLGATEPPRGGGP